MNPETRAQIIADCLAKIPHHKPVSLRDIEILMTKGEQATRQVIEAWVLKEGQRDIIYQPDVTETSNFVVRQLLDRFHSFSKEELMFMLVLGHAQFLVEELAAATNILPKIDPKLL